MFSDITKHPVLATLADSVAIIADEFERAVQACPDVRDVLCLDMVMDRPSNEWAWENGINREVVGYDLREGSFSMLAIYKPDSSVPSRIKDLFPQTLHLLGRLERKYYAAFTVLKAGSHIRRHSHTRRHLVYHLLLNDLEGAPCEMVCGDEVRCLRYRGDAVLFDYSLPHETSLHATNARVNMMVDFLP